MRELLRITVPIGLAVILVGCTSTSNSPNTPTPVVTVESVAVSGPFSSAAPGDFGQFIATARLSNGTTQNVTMTAAWQSSNSAVASVSPTGVVSVAFAGEAEIRASYQSVVGVAHIVSTAPSPPTKFTVCGLTKDADSGGGVSDVTVIVKDTALTATSARSGLYCFFNLASGQYPLRASKAGYDIGEIVVTVGAADVNGADIMIRKRP